MPYTATLQLRAKVQPSIKFKAKVQPNIKIKAQGLGEMISVRVSLSSTTFLNRGAVAFSPYSLFTFGTQGVWFDPSDAANLDWRRNLLTYSEQFDNAYWLKAAGVTVTPNTHTAPDGTMAADTLTSGANQISSPFIFSILASTVYTNSVYFRKTVGATYTPGIYLFFSGGTSVIYSAVVNTNTGVPTATTAGGFATPSNISVADAGDYWRLSVSGSSTNNTDLRFYVYPNFNPATSAAGAGTQVIWGAQTEVSTVATEYQRISDVNTEVLERFPNTTLYQDPAGTAPVTTPGQTVGLMLDKSKGLVLGSELVTNGDFASGTTGWSVTGGTQAVVSGALVVTPSPSGVVYSSQSFATVIGRTYQVRGSILAGTSTFFAIRKGDGATGGANQVTLRSSVGNLVGVFTATATTSFVILQANDSGSATFDNISIKELPGNHATQATLAARPTYAIEPAGGRRNLLTFTEQFDNPIWVKQSGTTVTANQTTAPNGTATADLVVGNGTSGIVLTGIVVSTTAANTKSIWLRGVSGGEVVQLKDPNFTLATITCNLTTSWQRFSLSEIQTGGLAGVWVANIPAGGIYLWGAQLELGSTATPYQRVTTQYDVTEAGKPTMSYLYFDGVNDAMVTSTITPGIGKAQVFAGVRKLDDGTRMIAEMGASGPFSLYNYSIGPVYTWTGATSGVITAPITNVITGTFDTATNSAALRLNSSQVGSGTPGFSGNVPAAVLNIGARSGSAIFLFGHLYSLITRFGANLDTPSITSTESWVASKTGFYSPVITGVPTVGVS